MARRTAAAFSGGALGLAGCLHLAWAAGATWPARTRAELGLVVSGSPVLPGPLPCAVVGCGLLATGVALAAGRPARPLRLVRVAVGSALAARGIVGGRVAARALGLPSPGPTFLGWDRRCYRPLCAALAVGVLASTGPRRT